MKNRILIIILFVLFALPVPLSLVSWIGSIISAADAIGMITNLAEVIKAVIDIIAMLLIGTYFITYIFSAHITHKRKELCLLSFLPLIHIIVTTVYFILFIK